MYHCGAPLICLTLVYRFVNGVESYPMQNCMTGRKALLNDVDFSDMANKICYNLHDPNQQWFNKMINGGEM